jgi:polysaccharide biosynthesis transport protein
MNEISPYTISPTFPGPQINPAALHGQTEESTVKRYWWIVRKHRWLIGAILMSAVTLAVIWYVSRTPLYRANATIMIQPQTPQVLDVKELLAEQVSNEEHDYYRTQYDILKSRSLAARVIRDLGLQGNPLVDDTAATRGVSADMLAYLRTQLRVWVGLGGRQESAADTLGVPPETIDSYLDKLSIQAERGTRLVVVGFTTANAALSARIANAHVQTYIRRGLEMHAEAGHNAEEFLQQKQIEVKEKVEKSEAALNKYRKDRGIVTLQSRDSNGEARGEPLMQRLTELNSELTKASGARIELESQHQLIRKGDYESLPAVISNPLIQKLKEEVGDLSVQYASMSNRFNPGYHPLDDLKARLNEAQEHLNREIGKVVESVESDYQAALASESELTREIEQVKSQAIRLNDASLQDAILEREVEANRQLYKTILQRMNEISVSSDLPASNVSIVDRAVAPPHPTGPGLVRVVVWTAFISLFGAVTLAFFLDSLDDTFKSAERGQPVPGPGASGFHSRLRTSQRKERLWVRLSFLRT